MKVDFASEENAFDAYDIMNRSKHLFQCMYAYARNYAH